MATPLWREGTFPLDWFALRASPVYYGYGVAQGRGEPWLLYRLPCERCLDVRTVWVVGANGYGRTSPTLAGNADLAEDHIATLLLDTIGRVYVETGQRVKVIGHSLGGMLARGIALDNPEIVERRDLPGFAVPRFGADASIADGGDGGAQAERISSVAQNMRPSCFSGQCSCAFGRNMSKPVSDRVGHFAIIQGMTGWWIGAAAMEEDAELNDEVNCTHIGMAFHPGVYGVLARRPTEEL